MLSTEKFPRTNEYWEELDVRQCMWTKWKTTYHVAEKKATIKNKSPRGKDQFGTAHSAMQQPAPLQPGETPVRDTQSTSLEELYRYFYNLATAETNEE